MGKVIPNANTWIGFTTTEPADINAPTATEVGAAETITPYVVSLNPTSSGNPVPTPALDSLFDRTIIGTSQGAFSGDFYRDDEDDKAWDMFPKGTKGYCFVSRFGGTGVDRRPVTGQSVEVWPVEVTQRAASNLASNTAQTFSLTAGVFDPPAEDAVVVAATGVPSQVRNLVATAGATGIVNLDWDVPSFVGTGVTGYKVYKSTTAGGAGVYTEVTTNITKIGTVANLTAVTAGLTYFKVVATNAAGDSAQSAFASCTAV
jgi:hypothetical protein